MKQSSQMSGPLTIWSKSEIELIPSRFRNILIGVLPLIYAMMFLFGLFSIFFPLQTFVTVVGPNYGYIWSGLIGLASAFSLFSLIFRLRLELYSSLVLSLLLIIYPIYVLVIIFNDPVHGGIDHLNSFFAIVLYPIMPCWRVVDISIEIRKSQRRQLYAESTKGD